MSKYNTLVNILDKIRSEAPSTYKSYHPVENNIEKLNSARSKAYIHLFLKVKFGLLSFLERENYITDGESDGGIDAYFINRENKKIYLIQSKFRRNANNFQNKEISVSELLKIDADRISRGHKSDISGKKYNNKILEIIKSTESIRDIGSYRWEVIIIANIKKITEEQISRIISGFPYHIYNYEKSYKELVFPVVCGTFYQADELIMNINLADKPHSATYVNYQLNANDIECEVDVLFVPTLEIAKNFNKYRNSILLNNPRSYLNFSHNPVNREILKTIRDKETNEFSLFNNGITIISDHTNISTRSAKINRGQVIVTNPQIINGGQTAYTLSILFEDAVNNKTNLDDIFKNKEVLLKIITFINRDEIPEQKLNELINDISKATNNQSSVKESDRRANDAIQKKIQNEIFNRYGFYYERKRGEFFDGLKNKYIPREKVIKRQEFLRVCYSIAGFPAESGRTGEKQLFTPRIFDKAIQSAEDIEKVFFSFLVFKALNETRSALQNLEQDPYNKSIFGHALSDGILVVTYIASKKDIIINDDSELDQFARKTMSGLLKQWSSFEQYALSNPDNKKYFKKIINKNSREVIIDQNFKSYYRGDTVRKDIDDYFKL